MSEARELLERLAASEGPEFTQGECAPLAFAALRAVLDLHQPQGTSYDVQQCRHCDELCHSYSGLGCEQPDGAWPCPTVQVITDELSKVSWS